MRFLIVEALWDGLNPTRETEWQQTLMDINRKHDGSVVTVTVGRRDDGGATLAVEGLDGGPAEIALTFDMMRDHFRDYREIITRLARADLGAFGMRDWEVLDMAKKGVHDEAGMRIKRAFKPWVPLDLKFARRIFTLVFLVTNDLPGALVKKHRTHGLPS